MNEALVVIGAALILLAVALVVTYAKGSEQIRSANWRVFGTSESTQPKHVRVLTEYEEHAARERAKRDGGDAA